MRQEKGLRVLSLFDGMSCGQIALRDLGIPIEVYYASEIDKFAIQQTQLNFPDTVQLGDVRNIDVDKLCEDGEIDLLIGGSPCVNLSFAGKRAGLATKENMEILTLGQYLDLKEADFEFEGQSYLFWEFMRILTVLRRRNPNIMFLLENVEMGKKWERVLSEAIGIHGVHINSALVSAQNRKRIYWSNIRVREEGLFGYRYTDIPQPTDRGIMLKDILETEVEEKYYLKDEVVQKLLEHKERHKEAGHGFGAVFHDIYGKMGAVKVGGSGVDDLIKDPVCVGMRGKNQDNLIAYGRLDDQFCLNKKRNELGRQIRKEYEAGTIKARRSDLVDYAPREDDKTGPITTVQSDNLILQNSHLQKNLTEVDGKANSFLATSHKGAWANGMSLVGEGFRIRRITPTECARLQTIPEWYRWEYVKKFIDVNLCEPNVELTAAKDILQTKRPDYVICTILGSSERVQQMQDQKLIKQKNAQWKVAIESKLHTWDYASCTIKDSQSMDHAISCRFNQNMQRRVLYVENLSMEEMGLQKDCAQNIIAVLKYTGIQVKLIEGMRFGEIILDFMDICQDATEWQSTEEFLKITLAGNSIEENVFTISILIKQIIELRTYIFSILKANTKKLMLNFLLSQLSVSSVALLSLRMGIIESTSETQQYRLLGNGWNIETIKHIFSFMRLEDTV